MTTAARLLEAVNSQDGPPTSPSAHPSAYAASQPTMHSSHAPAHAPQTHHPLVVAGSPVNSADMPTIDQQMQRMQMQIEQCQTSVKAMFGILMQALQEPPPPLSPSAENAADQHAVVPIRSDRPPQELTQRWEAFKNKNRSFLPPDIDSFVPTGTQCSRLQPAEASAPVTTKQLHDQNEHHFATTIAVAELLDSRLARMEQEWKRRMDNMDEMVQVHQQQKQERERKRMEKEMASKIRKENAHESLLRDLDERLAQKIPAMVESCVESKLTTPLTQSPSGSPKLGLGSGFLAGLQESNDGLPPHHLPGKILSGRAPPSSNSSISGIGLGTGAGTRSLSAPASTHANDVRELQDQLDGLRFQAADLKSLAISIADEQEKADREKKERSKWVAMAREKSNVLAEHQKQLLALRDGMQQQFLHQTLANYAPPPAIPNPANIVHSPSYSSPTTTAQHHRHPVSPPRTTSPPQFPPPPPAGSSPPPSSGLYSGSSGVPPLTLMPVGQPQVIHHYPTTSSQWAPNATPPHSTSPRREHHGDHAPTSPTTTSPRHHHHHHHHRHHSGKHKHHHHHHRHRSTTPGGTRRHSHRKSPSRRHHSSHSSSRSPSSYPTNYTQSPISGSTGLPMPPSVSAAGGYSSSGGGGIQSPPRHVSPGRGYHSGSDVGSPPGGSHGYAVYGFSPSDASPTGTSPPSRSQTLDVILARDHQEGVKHAPPAAYTPPQA